MIRYRCIKENRIYTEEQLRKIFRIAEYNGWHNSFGDWVKMEIKKGYIEVVTDDCRTTDILDYMTGKRKLAIK